MTSTLVTPSAQMSFEEALAAVAAHADRQWKDIALSIVRHIASVLPELTTDNVWLALSETLAHTPEPRAIGAIMLQAARRGWIAPTDRVVKTVRPEAHKRPIAIWKSLLYQP